MTDARVERVHANRADARVFLEQGKPFKADANGPLGRESAAVLLHSAVISGADAVL
jgi:hypothetical protein